MVKPGQEVKVKVTIDNTGTEAHTFPIGVTIRHIATEKDYDLPLQNEFETTGPGTGSETFAWKIPSNAPKGPYSVIAAVWKSRDNATPSGRLDDDVVPNAFTIN